MTMMENCPNCGEKVFFSGPICPSCGKDREQVAAHPAGKPPPPAIAKTSGAESNSLAFWAAMALIVLAVCSFVYDWTMVADTGSIDYRNRVTGMRLLSKGIDPYHYKWTTGKPEQFCDPYENPNVPITKTTVSPAMLVAGWPLAVLPYGTSKAAWLLAEWAMLAGIWLMWLKWSGHTSASRWWWSVLVVGFSFTLTWRHHVDHGQGYLLWAFLLSGWLRLSVLNRSGWPTWLAGLVAGLLVCLRPPLLLAVGPLLVLRRRNQVLGAVFGVLLGLGLPALLKPDVWQDYGRAMATWSQLYRTQSEPRPGQRAIPPKIEGISTDQLASFWVKQFVDSSLYRIGRYAGWQDISDKAMLAALCLAFGLWLLLSRPASDPAFMLGLAAWCYLADGFLPAYRYPYGDVMIIATIAMLPALGLGRKFGYGLALIGTAAGIWIVNIHPPQKEWIYLPPLGLALLALFVILLSSRRRGVPNQLSEA
jgi:hypothetical protein